MITNLTKQDLIDFEEDIAREWENGNIRAPIHLEVGNEEGPLKIFDNIKQEDWVFASWRSHYKCLLKGVPREELKKAILDGRSISLCFPNYNIYSSGIVGGNVPPAVGMAMDLKRKHSAAKVYCFVGDMTSQTGIFNEAVRYVYGHNLPITFIVEDNEKSVCTNSRNVWGGCFTETYEDYKNVEWYDYTLKYPHAGVGKRIEF